MNIPPNTVNVLRSVPLPDEAATMHTNAAVLDVGSCSTRLGFAGDTAPRMRQRTCVVKGRACFDEASAILDESDDPAAATVLKSGVIADWEAYEQLMERVVCMLDLGNAEHSTPLLLTEKALVPDHQRRKIAELLFETYHVGAASFALSPVLALYASGLSTGVSVELGNDQSHVVPVFQGLSLFHATHALDLGGAALTRHFTSLMSPLATGLLPLMETMTSAQQESMWEYVKERHCSVAESKQAFSSVDRFTASPSSGSVSSAGQGAAEDRYKEDFVLPDGTVLPVSGAARFTPGESYFQPSLSPALQHPRDQSAVVDEVLLRSTHTPLSVPELIVDAMQRCDHDLLPTFASHVVLSGGASLLRGVAQRMESEVQARLAGISVESTRLIADVERRDAAFVGGSIWASLPAAQSLWVSKSDYEEVGPLAVVRGCF
ncbi:putative actin-like protein [Leptomonas pyrrhocoris]|uniref:Putative actin-like protein n=1 Tax=Leptomonas pyrrhocoris TaxID=157538 RepID=A0A0N0VDA4_LEPPY|nr:putative actin-like protein [Leptomonas pyrrhocoris]XP_015653498.1 putative actin-like protein [Leptomonas pyrrhocoris]KPA75058.1 putative actin-like protein [Leptomonas pyrrhocoris]KPA75059.1 putative actin-like protein [Leptomonas pyrrhocoris]|eukprot:XP_015653497.1 putative actin-like protein [Leptomonas pyrrhocoris]